MKEWPFSLSDWNAESVRRSRVRKSLRSYIAREGILLHRSKHCEDPWCALLPFPKDKGKEIGAIMAESCRLYEESGRVAFGPGDLTTVRLLCAKLKLDGCP